MIGSEQVKWEVREAQFGSEDYQDYRALRFAELRRPLGMEWAEDDLEKDERDRHFGLYRDGELVGTAVVVGLGDGVAKLRQIAVIGSKQGEGWGRRLMKLVEESLAGEGVGNCELNARLAVAGFYLKTGYEQVGEIFEEIGIPHVKMRKLIKQGGSA